MEKADELSQRPDWYYMSSLSIPKIYPCGDVVIIISQRQAHLP